MDAHYLLTGTRTDDHTIALDEALPLGPTRVRVTLEPLEERTSGGYEEAMKRIRTRQDARGYRGGSRAEVDARVEAERESWAPEL